MLHDSGHKAILQDTRRRGRRALDAGPGRDQPAPAPMAVNLPYCQVVKPIDSFFGEPPEIALTRNWVTRPSPVLAHM